MLSCNAVAALILIRADTDILLQLNADSTTPSEAVQIICTVRSNYFASIVKELGHGAIAAHAPGALGIAEMLEQKFGKVCHGRI